MAHVKEANPDFFNAEKIKKYSQALPAEDEFNQDMIIGIELHFDVSHVGMFKLMRKAEDNFFIFSFSVKRNALTLEVFWHNRNLLEGYDYGKEH